MSALCAFPPLIPAAGAVYSAGYMAAADVGASAGRIGSFAAFAQHQQQQQSHQQQQQQQTQSRPPAYGSTFAAFHHPSAGLAAPGKSIMMTKQQQQQPESAWSSRTANSAIDVPPAAKRRCTDKARTAGWLEQQPQSLWSSNASCPSGCTMCHIQQQQHHHQQQQQQQQQQHQQQQQQVYPSNGFVTSTGATQFDARRPLQEKHQNREDASIALLQNHNNNNNGSSVPVSQKPTSKDNGQALAGRSVIMVGNRALAVDPKKDYSAPLHVDCSVEYDLPRIVRPPPGAQPLLILAPPRHSIATPTYQSSPWTSGRPVPPQWGQATSSSASSSASSNQRVKSESSKPQQQQQPAPVKPVQQQQQPAKLNPSGAVRKSNSNGNGTNPCGCPSCCLRPSAAPPVNVYAGLGGGAGWMNQHWSPPAGTTASSAGFGYAPIQQPQQQHQHQAQQQQQQQQQPQAGYQMASFHAINQEQQQQTVINSRRRKRSPEAPMPSAADKIQRLYSTAQWMPDPSSLQAAFLLSQRYVAPSPAAWTMSAQPIKFHC